MSSLHHNFPCFAPDNTYQHKINANAAWIKQEPRALAPSPKRRAFAPVINHTNSPLTAWGTAYPLWREGDTVLVQLQSPAGEWHRATILETLMPAELRDVSEDEASKIPPSQLAKMTCRYTVKLLDGGDIDNVWTEVLERHVVPAYLREKLEANKVTFKMAERVMVQMQASDGKKAQSHIGFISGILEDKISRDKADWHVAPRMYQVYLEGLEKSGYWTASSILKLPQPPMGVLPPPPGLVPSQRI